MKDSLFLELKALDDYQFCHRYVKFMSSLPQENESNLSEENRQTAAVYSSLLHTRNISPQEAIQRVYDPKVRKSEGNKLLKKMLIDGIKCFVLGGVILTVGLVLSQNSEMVFIGAIVMGGIMFLLSFGYLGLYLHAKYFIK